MAQSESKQVPQPTRKDGKIRFALLGDSGTGKSSFVNAIRGHYDYDYGAAQTGVTETTREPTEYAYPDNPKISFVDLPGIGTPTNPDVSTYCRNVGLEDYDIFLLVISSRFTVNDLHLAQLARSMGKSLFVIRTKIDKFHRNKRRKERFNEEKMLQAIQKDIIENMTDLISSEKQIFLISNCNKDKWDFPRLVAAINAELPVPEGEWSTYSSSNITRDNLKRMARSLREETDTEEADEKEKKEEPEQTEEPALAEKPKQAKHIGETTDLTGEYLADAKAYIQENGDSGIGEFLRKKLYQSKPVKIRFGITGDSGTGKSSFINAIRGLDDDDYVNRAAKVSEIETTLEPAEYEYPDNKRITLVDLPGIGTPNFPDLATYCRKVGLENYDTFLIFTATRFTNDDLELAKKVKSFGKSFFLIRTKIDVDLMPKKRKAAINEEATLQTIRNDCMKNLKGLISSEKEIFLIDNYDREKWDFDRLVKAIGDALPVLQREVLLLSLSHLTRGCIKRKAMMLKARAVLVAAVSAGQGAIPLPISRAVLDAALIKDTITDYYRRLGIHDITPNNFERFNEFEEVLRRYNFQSDEELVLPLESEARGARNVQSVFKYIPVVGTAIAGSISFVLMLRYLNRSVNELEEVALAVWETQNSEKQSEMN